MNDIDRRRMLALSAAAIGAAYAESTIAAEKPGAVAQWDIFEIALKGPTEGNPFRDVTLGAVFSRGDRSVKVRGFYDGDGVYKIRFMPDQQGEWTYVTTSSFAGLGGKSGSFRCAAPQAGVYGPVGVMNGHHFGYADKTPFFPFGTTSYAWIHQSEALQQETLKTLKAAPFNKIRMCVFPKSYEYNNNEPELYPFERDAGGKSDFTRPNPAFFRHLETRIADLRDMKIEADLILFHPYDRWGYAAMPSDDDDAYLRYIVARLASYRNIWWSMANEYDFMKAKTTQDFDRFFRIVSSEDPSRHLRSIHHGHVPYDYSRPWVTHASLQTSDFSKTAEDIAAWRKPIVYDEVQYEGNLNRRWGNLSGQEMTWRFWRGVMSGAYVTHGETLLDPNGPFDETATPTLWWAHGGDLRGASPERIRFLRTLCEETAKGKPEVRAGMEAQDKAYYPCTYTYLDDEKTVSTIFYYFDYHQPIWNEFPLPEGIFMAEHIDPWEMTVTPIEGQFNKTAKIKLSATPYQALRFRRV